MLRIVTLLGLLALSAPALAQPLAEPALGPALKPELKPAVTVSSELVRIGDMVAHAGPLAKTAIFRAPDLGETGAVATARVIEALRPFDLAGIDTGGLSEVLVTRASRAITPKEIETRIVQALAGQRGLADAADLSLTLDQTLRTLQVEPSLTGELQVARLTYDPRSTRFSIALDLPGSAILSRAPLTVSGSAVQTAETVFLTRSVRRGEVLTRSDVSVERRPRAEISADRINAPDQAIGLAARQALRAGQPLRETDLKRPELVQRNEAVTLVFEMPGILLTVRGKALETGAGGDVVSVLNLQSKRTVQGVVAGPGRVNVAVAVAVATPRFAANAAALASPRSSRRFAE